MATAPQAEQIAGVRRFNRAFTRRIGVLDDNYLGRGRPLAQSRLLFEVGPDGAELRDLRERLALDSGYLSRLLRALEQAGLLETRRSPTDGRARRLVLTARGRREVAALDRESERFAAALLGPLGDSQRRRLLAAMVEVDGLLAAASIRFEPEAPDSADAMACQQAYFGELHARFENGFDPGRGTATAAAELQPPQGVLLLARLDGRAVACGAVRVIGPHLAEIKRMWVAPAQRGFGIAPRLLAALETQALALGCPTVRLDTNGALTEAIALYRRSGYRAIPRYNDNPYAQHWFEKALG